MTRRAGIAIGKMGTPAASTRNGASMTSLPRTLRGQHTVKSVRPGARVGALAEQRAWAAVPVDRVAALGAFGGNAVRTTN
jgi:hypothetical protein